MLFTHELFDLQGTAVEQRMAKSILDRTKFPWYALLPGLAQDTGKTKIPFTWDDLSRFNTSNAAASVEEDHGDHDHDHSGDEKFHTISRVVNGRSRVLGLAYYSGRVSIERTLIHNPPLAGEVTVSEGAHMIDFFWMRNEHRVGLWNAFHVDEPEHQLPLDTVVTDGKDLGHGHGWFDVGGYYSWVGEALMGLIVKGYSDFPLTIHFDHPITPAVLQAGRRALTPYFGVKNGKYFHDQHGRAKPEVYFTDRKIASLNRVPCPVCKP